MSDQAVFIGAFTVVVLIMIGAAILSGWTGYRKAGPSLIDLHEYEADLLDDRDRGGLLRPVVPIPELGELEPGALEAMRKNRRVAQEIYDRVKAGR